MALSLPPVFISTLASVIQSIDARLSSNSGEAPLYLASVLHPRFLMATQAGITPPAGDSSPNPAYVPLFESHAHHIRSSTGGRDAKCPSPVGICAAKWRSPSLQLNRLELRICDLVTDPIALLAIAPC